MKLNKISCLNKPPIGSNCLNLFQQLSESQKLIAEKLSSNASHRVQIISINDITNAISYFLGKKAENVSDWLKEVERIAAHAH